MAKEWEKCQKCGYEGDIKVWRAVGDKNKIAPCPNCGALIRMSKQEDLNELIDEADDIYQRIVSRGKSKLIYKKALEIAKRDNKELEIEYIQAKIDLIDEKYDNALKHLNKVIKIDHDNWKALHYKANIFIQKKQYTRAIELYDKITENNSNVISWYNKGIAYFNLQKFETAVECFDEALKIDPEHALSWNKKSAALTILNRYNEAIEAYETALEIDPEHPLIRNNKSLPKMFLGRFDDARKDKEKVFSEKKEKIKDLKLSPEEESEKISEVEEKEKEQFLEMDALKKVIEVLENDYDSILDQKKDYENALFNLLKKPQPREDISDENYLMILRRWNSYTPAMLTDLDSNVGGGYFINWKGKGIVIDPGFDFLENFFNAGLVIEDIDAVIITHAHIDHCNDFESLLTLIYEYNENVEKEYEVMIESLNKKIKKSYESIEKEDKKANITKEIASNLSLDFISDLSNLWINYDKIRSKDIFNDVSIKFSKDTNEYFNPQKKRIDVFMNLGAKKKYLAWIPIEEDKNEVKIKRLYPLEKGVSYKLDDYNIELKVTEAIHNEVLCKTYSCGLILEMHDDINDPNSKPIKIGYTSDTMHNENIEDQYRDVDIIIPHLGSIDENDFISNSKKRNSNHLMLKGVISTIYRSNAELAIISEFGEELKQHKLKIVKALDEVFQNEGRTKCLTGDVGLKIYLPEKTVKCYYNSSSCLDNGRGVHLEEILEEIDPKRDSEKSVIHFCPSCKNIYDRDNEEYSQANSTEN